MAVHHHQPHMLHHRHKYHHMNPERAAVIKIAAHPFDLVKTHTAHAAVEAVAGTVAAVVEIVTDPHPVAVDHTAIAETEVAAAAIVAVAATVVAAAASEAVAVVIVVALVTAVVAADLAVIAVADEDAVTAEEAAAVVTETTTVKADTNLATVTNLHVKTAAFPATRVAADSLVIEEPVVTVEVAAAAEATSAVVEVTFVAAAEAAVIVVVAAVAAGEDSLVTAEAAVDMVATAIDPAGKLLSTHLHIRGLTLAFSALAVTVAADAAAVVEEEDGLMIVETATLPHRVTVAETAAAEVAAIATQTVAITDQTDAQAAEEAVAIIGTVADIKTSADPRPDDPARHPNMTRIAALAVAAHRNSNDFVFQVQSTLILKMFFCLRSSDSARY